MKGWKQVLSVALWVKGFSHVSSLGLTHVGREGEERVEMVGNRGIATYPWQKVHSFYLRVG